MQALESGESCQKLICGLKGRELKGKSVKRTKDRAKIVNLIQKLLK